MSDLDNAHVDVDGSYTYNVCARHLDYNLGTSSSGNYVDLFYVTEQNNSALWTDKGYILIDPDDWYSVSLSSSDGSFDYVINSSDMSNQDYICLAKIDEDNVYGSHIGSCDSSVMPDKLWVKLT